MKTKKLTLCFLVLGIMLVSFGVVSAAHTSTATISPSGWLKSNTATNFSISVTNDGTSTSQIKRVIINIPLPGYSALSCGVAPAGWGLISDPSYCQYDTSSDRIAIGSSKTFTVTTTTSSNVGDVWSVSTRDQGNDDDNNDIAPIVPTIQSVINSASAGSTINVPAGTYTEDLTINEAIILQAEGVVTINGKHTITASNVILRGFILAPVGGHGIIIDSSSSPINNITITNNTFTLLDYSGVHIGGESVANPNKVSNVNISRNTFNGPTSKIANPFKIGGYYAGSVISTEIDNIDFEYNTINKASIPIGLQNKNINDILINNNTFRNTDGAIYFWAKDGTTPTGILSNFVFTNNDIDSTNSYGVGIDANVNEFSDINFGTGNRINYNKFVNIPGLNLGGSNWFRGVSILSTLTTYNLNATFNWWGTANKDLIAGNVSTKVTYSPWWYSSTGAGSDNVKPNITFRNTPYNSEVSVAITNINIIISDDSGIEDYTIDWDDGTGTELLTGTGATSVTLTPDGGSITYSSIGTYVLNVTATDSVGNKATATTTVTIYEKPDWVINLISGQSNFVSIPFSPKDDDADGDVDYKDVLEKVRPNLDRVWAYTYDETTKTNLWHYRKTTSTGSWSTTGDLQAIVPGYGYIVFMKNDSVLYGKARTISGNSGDEPVVPASVKLANGYNLIGVFGNVSDTTSVLLSSLKSDAIQYWHKVLDKNEVNVTTIQPNKAYWISMKHLPGLATEDYYTYYP